MSFIKKPGASVIVATYNRCKDLEKCLASLMKQTIKDFEIVVIDNGSTDETPEILKKFPVRIIRNSTKNLFYLYNLGWRSASSDLVIYLSDDSEAEPNWLENCLKTFGELDYNLGALAGPVISTQESEIANMYNSIMHSKTLSIAAKIYNLVICEGKLFSEIATLCESGAYTIGSTLIWSTELDKPVPIDTFGNNNIVVKKSIIRKLGGFDENFHFSGDGDFYIRLRNAGYKLMFNPKAVVWHHVHPGGPTRLAYYIGRDSALFYLKHIRPKTLSGWLRFILNLMCFNAYWIYKFHQTGESTRLKGIKGFVDGVIFYFSKARKEYYSNQSRNQTCQYFSKN